MSVDAMMAGLLVWSARAGEADAIFAQAIRACRGDPEFHAVRRLREAVSVGDLLDLDEECLSSSCAVLGRVVEEKEAAVVLGKESAGPLWLMDAMLSMVHYCAGVPRVYTECGQILSNSPESPHEGVLKRFGRVPCVWYGPLVVLGRTAAASFLDGEGLLHQVLGGRAGNVARTISFCSLGEQDRRRVFQTSVKIVKESTLAAGCDLVDAARLQGEMQMLIFLARGAMEHLDRDLIQAFRR